MFEQGMQYLVTGLTTGFIYALIAVGFVTIYNVTGLVNFAQGEFVMIGALTCISFYQAGLPLLAAAILSVLLTAAVGLLFERTLLYPVRNASLVTLILITIGASILLRGIGMIIWGTYPLSLPPFSQGEPIQFLGAVIIPQSIWVFATVIVLLGLLYVFFEKTFIGAAVRACVNNPQASMLMGINPQSMTALAFTMSAGLGAIAGILVAPIMGGIYDMGLLLGLKGFVAMVIGGMGNVPGAVVGGLLLGVLEAFAGGYISTAYSEAITFALLLLILFVSPNGLLAKATGKRV